MRLRVHSAAVAAEYAVIQTGAGQQLIEEGKWFLLPRSAVPVSPCVRLTLGHTSAALRRFRCHVVLNASGYGTGYGTGYSTSTLWLLSLRATAATLQGRCVPPQPRTTLSGVSSSTGSLAAAALAAAALARRVAPERLPPSDLSACVKFLPPVVLPPRDLPACVKFLPPVVLPPRDLASRDMLAMVVLLPRDLPACVMFLVASASQVASASDLP
jgi:hypothetical protein